ncbi:MAG: type II toxin-antitoxin system RelE/ParE family toxin [Verrucomicrobiae bacterium]|nr:type II toxin-antitoxin system RelE/ParE family toxin [Verrucomicrobiae bacterium]
MYKTEAGKFPVVEFIETIRVQSVTARIVKVFEMVEQLPNPPASFLKKLTGCDDIWEVRAITHHQSFRFLGFYDGKRLILTNGFAKQTDKTPPQEINLAKRRKEMYFSGRRELL